MIIIVRLLTSSNVNNSATIAWTRRAPVPACGRC